MTLLRLIDIFGQDLGSHFWRKYSYDCTDGSGNVVQQFNNVKFHENLSGDSRNIYDNKSLWHINQNKQLK